DVYKLPDKKYIGNIEEGFLERLKPGDIFVLGGKLYEFRYAKAMRCYVSQAPKEAVPTIPAWFSELLPLSFDLALEIQKFRKEMKKKFEKGENKEEITSWLLKNYPIDK
ncbi:MAG: ATP-dependent helicase, partial [Nitrososphaerota archaeon]